MSESVTSVVVVGAGQAACQAVASLREEGFSGAITVIGDEPVLPYQRPPLSKAFLAGTLEADRLALRPAAFYRQADVDMRIGVRVVAIDRDAGTVRADDGESFPYDRLLIATGSRVRRLDVPGADLDGIHMLRTLADSRALRAAFAAARRLVIVGGGYIGLEVAAVAIRQGLEVTVLEAADRVMGRVVAPEISQFYERVHRDAGVRIETGVSVVGFAGNGHLEGVVVSGGGGESVIAAERAVVGVGVMPETDLAAAAGLAIDNGIVVDEYAQTSDPAITAAGDCTIHPSRIAGKRVRLESVHNAAEQAKTAAASMIGKRTPYDQVPWFWSDQYDLKLQIAGLASGDRVVVRGDPLSGAFAAFHMDGDLITAVDAVNRAGEFMMGRRLIARGARIAPERIADESIPIKNIADDSQ